ncbi:MAG: hypothetical protein M3O09_06325, partial [Acidobacteriota bacterium]|nr:hypothetical protein [Acidobacteriota bacterium]
TGEIFRTDFTGDGTVGDPLPGTKFGAFERGVNASNVNQKLATYNSTVANTPTPAGQILIANSLFTSTQLQELGGVAPHICLAPPAIDNDPSCTPNTPGSQQDFPWLRATDLRLSWSHLFHERFRVEPSVAFYNVFNFSNFDLPPNTMNGLLTGTGSGALNGTTRIDQESFRVGNGTGVYGLGSERQIEFGLRLVF